MRAAAAAFGVGERAPEDADVIVDALFGSGFHGRLEGAAEALAERVNGLAAPIVALDVPSGVDGASGRVEGAAIAAELTLAFHGRTLGTAIEPGRGHSGEVVELPIGLPGALAGPERAVRMDPADLALVPRRSPTGSKYDAGGVLVVGGSPGMSGAPALAALAAFRAGAGVVWVCVPESEHAAVAAHAPELMVHGGLGPSACSSSRRAPAPSSLGPGLGRAPEARASSSTRSCAGSRRRSCSTPMRSSRSPGRLETLARAPGPTALTPHAGELGRLLGRDSAAVAAARLAAVSEAAERSGAAVLLKGPDTLVAAPGEPLRIVETSVPQLATAGAGDVLGGAVGGTLRARAAARAGARPGRGRARLGGAPRRLRGRGDRRVRPAAAARAPARVTPLDARGRSRRGARERARLIDAAGGSRLWAVVKADGYGHGAVACAGAALSAGAERICCATLERGARAAGGARRGRGDRRALAARARRGGARGRLRDRRLLARGLRQAARRGRRLRRARQGRHRHGALGHVARDALATGRELAAGSGPLRLAGLMSHLATADGDPGVRGGCRPPSSPTLAREFPPCPRHLANSAAALTLPETRYDAVRCGIALYGVSPFGDDPAGHGLPPALRWTSRVAGAARPRTRRSRPATAGG